MSITTLDLSADIIDTLDIIARIEELEDQTAGIRSGSPLSPTEFLKAYRSFHYPREGYSDSLLAELATLTAIMDDLKGCGGDEQWRGDWYPLTLVRDSYFRAYAQDLAYDCDLVDQTASWPMNCIDWDKAARELKYDYTSTEIYGITYWYR